MSSENNKIKRIFLTHCSAKKDNSLKGKSIEVTPDQLYSATATQRFMNKCKNAKANWAIFSDKYGIWFSDTVHEWYEKDPNKVTDEEFNVLVQDFNSKLKDFDEIWFTHLRMPVTSALNCTGPTNEK